MSLFLTMSIVLEIKKPTPKHKSEIIRVVTFSKDVGKILSEEATINPKIMRRVIP